MEERNKQQIFEQNFVILNFKFVNTQIISKQSQMSFQSLFQSFRDKSRIVINDRFMGDQGAKQLSLFLEQHGRVQSLEIKTNDISSAGFINIFQALQKNPKIRQLIIQYNNLGQESYNDWQNYLCSLLSKSSKLQRLNISNNKIGGQSFKKIATQLASSNSLKLLEIRYNTISSGDIQVFTSQLKAAKNQTLLYVELAGNKLKKQSIQSLQNFLKQNRNKNPLSKDKLMMTGGFDVSANQNVIVNSVNNFYMNKTNAIDDLSKQNVIKHLEDLLDQNRKDTAEMKVRLQKQLQQLQRRQKNDSRQLNELDRKCNQLMVQNRNLKFELERNISQHEQIQRDQDHNVRIHEQKLRQANKQLVELESKYQQIQDRMAKQHEMKMKQIARQWQARLRSIEDKIRQSQNENNLIQNEIKKSLQKKQRLRLQYLQQESSIRTRVEDEESQRYGFKIAGFQAKLKEVQQTRERYLRRNQQLLYEIQKTESNNSQQIESLEDELSQLRVKQEEFLQRNKDFLNRNQKLKSQISLKEISIEKLQEQVNRLNEQIQTKKSYNRQQINKIITDHSYSRGQREQDKKAQIQKLNNLQATLRNAQLQNAKLRQQYGILAQRLQISLGQAVQQVFSENNFY